MWWIMEVFTDFYSDLKRGKTLDAEQRRSICWTEKNPGCYQMQRSMVRNLRIVVSWFASNFSASKLVACCQRAFGGKWVDGHDHKHSQLWSRTDSRGKRCTSWFGSKSKQLLNLGGIFFCIMDLLVIQTLNEKKNNQLVELAGLRVTRDSSIFNLLYWKFSIQCSANRTYLTRICNLIMRLYDNKVK